MIRRPLLSLAHLYGSDSIMVYKLVTVPCEGHLNIIKVKEYLAWNYYEIVLPVLYLKKVKWKY